MLHATDPQREGDAMATTPTAEVDAASVARPSVWLQLSPGRPFVVLFSTIAGLALGAVLVVLLDRAGVSFRGYERLARELNADGESNLTTWFSSVVLALVALSSVTAAQLSRRAGLSWRPWLLLAAAFAYVSFDELTRLHEQLNRPLRNLLGVSGALHFAWVIVAVPMVLIFVVVMLGFLRRLPSQTRWGLVGAGALYVAGAIGVELPSAVITEQGGAGTLGYEILAIVEEVLEMLGMATALLVISRYTAGFPVAGPEPVAVPAAAP
jgi:hypothetical protein